MAYTAHRGAGSIYCSPPQLSGEGRGLQGVASTTGTNRSEALQCGTTCTLSPCPPIQLLDGAIPGSGRRGWAAHGAGQLHWGSGDIALPAGTLKARNSSVLAILLEPSQQEIWYGPDACSHFSAESNPCPTKIKRNVFASRAANSLCAMESNIRKNFLRF